MRQIAPKLLALGPKTPLVDHPVNATCNKYRPETEDQCKASPTHRIFLDDNWR